MRKVVVNTTPLIALANIGQLELLRELYGEVFIPDAVMEEIRSEPARSLVKDANWIKRRTIAHPEQKMLYKARLHAGEVEVMILAQEESADLVIMDDNMKHDNIRVLEFAIFCIENLAVRLHIRPREAHDMLAKCTDLLHSYIIPSYDVLHTQDKDYIIEDIVEALKLKGMAV